MRNSKWVVFVGAGVPGLSPAEISTLEETYWSEQDDAEKKLERDLVESLVGVSYLSRDEVESVIRWKTLTQGGRASRFIESLQAVSDEEIVLVSNAALSVERLRTQIDVLRSLPGVGVGVATSILGFVFPETHVVVDYNVYNGVFGESVGSVSASQAVELVEALRAEYGELECSLRAVDRALFVKFDGFGE